MSDAKLKEADVEAAAEALGIKLKQGNGATIASMIAEIRQSVYRKASALAQDAPPSVFFDAR
jgi:hypothetical protein